MYWSRVTPTPGVTANGESFPNRLESLLCDRDGDETWEVINAGTPYTGPTCYLGMLTKHLDLDPDLFIATLFTGNDFWDDFRIRSVQDGTWPPPTEKHYYKRIQAAKEICTPALYQGFNQIARFTQSPEERRESMMTVIESYKRMHDLCVDRGIDFVALILPIKTDVEPGDEPEVLEGLLAALELEDANLARAMGLEFAAAMQELGIPCIDPFEDLRSSEEPCYWREDYHIGLRGHEVVARVLYRELEQLLQ